jgi:hypothetical protein
LDCELAKVYVSSTTEGASVKSNVCVDATSVDDQRRSYSIVTAEHFQRDAVFRTHCTAISEDD